jgi:hypothetical protein
MALRVGNMHYQNFTLLYQALSVDLSGSKSSCFGLYLKKNKRETMEITKDLIDQAYKLYCKLGEITYQEITRSQDLQDFHRYFRLCRVRARAFLRYYRRKTQYSPPDLS